MAPESTTRRGMTLGTNAEESNRTVQDEIECLDDIVG